MLTATGFLAVLCLAALLLSQLRAQAQKPSAQPAPAGREGGDQRESTDPAKEIEKLKEEIQGLKAELAEQRRQTTAIVNHLTLAPELDVQPEDYAERGAGSEPNSYGKGLLLKPGPLSSRPLEWLRSNILPANCASKLGSIARWTRVKNTPRFSTCTAGMPFTLALGTMPNSTATPVLS